MFGCVQLAARMHSVPLTASVDPAPGRPVISDYYPHAQLVQMMRGLNPARDFSGYDQALRTVRAGKMRMTVGSSGTVLLHDMQADPGQTQDLSGQRPRVLARLQQQLATAPVSAPAGPAPRMDPETLEKKYLGKVSTHTLPRTLDPPTPGTLVTPLSSGRLRCLMCDSR